MFTEAQITSAGAGLGAFAFGWLLRAFAVGRRVGALEQVIQQNTTELQALRTEYRSTNQRIDQLLIQGGVHGPR